MKKIFYLIGAFAVMWGIVSCDNEPKNPGDYSIKPYLTFGDFVSLVDGQSYPISMDRIYDTVFQYPVVLYDSIFNEEGEFERRQARDTIYQPATFTTKWYKANNLDLTFKPDTLVVEVSSNSRWKTPDIVSNQDWPKVNGPAQFGGGDGNFKVELDENYWAFNITGTLYIHTSDSTIFYEIPIIQHPENW